MNTTLHPLLHHAQKADTISITDDERFRKVCVEDNMQRAQCFRLAAQDLLEE